MDGAPHAVLILLFAIAPIMRGGNRNVAMILLECVALVFLAALLSGSVNLRDFGDNRLKRFLLWTLLFSPVWLAVIYLTPIPAGLWFNLSGRQGYLSALTAAHVPVREYLPISLAPDATQVSLLSGLPLVAAFLGGFLSGEAQLRRLFTVVVIVAFIEVTVSLLQVIGGPTSPLYFGGYFGWGGRPIGTFGNANHLANYLNMALTVYGYLGWRLMKATPGDQHVATARSRIPLVLWLAGAVFIVVGVLLTRSRGALLTGLPLAALAFAVVIALRTRGRARIASVTLALAALVGAIGITGVDFALSRFGGWGSDAAMRRTLASDTLRGAWDLFPWGAGWGAFAGVFPRFQSPQIVGIAEYAHADYAQIFFEGGIFAVPLFVAFGWLAIGRAAELARSLRSPGGLRAQMITVLSGMGLLGFLLHSIAEFNMHIPANAMLAGLLAGTFLQTQSRGRQRNSEEAE